VKLYDNPLSPYAMKVRVTLYEKGLEFENHEVHFHSQRDALLRVNPRGEVPALQDGDAVIYDSRVICEYLEDKYPSPPLTPSDPAAKARCRQLETICDTQIDACALVIGLIKIFRPEMEADHADALGQAATILGKHHANLDAELRGREYLLGEFSRADVALIPHLGFTAFMGYPVDPKYTNLTGWMTRMNERPSVQRALQEAMACFEASQAQPPAGEQPLFNPQNLHWRNDRIEALIRVGLGPWLLEELAAGRAFFSPVP